MQIRTPEAHAEPARVRVTTPTLRIVLLAAAITALQLQPAAAWPGGSQPRKSVVKIYVTQQRSDYAAPWQSSNPMTGNGSGFIIAKRRILTNAHVVSDARFLEAQREGDPRKYPAEVEFVAHDCDLAILRVSDPAFFVGSEPLDFGAALPQLNDEVTVLGYPMGGVRLSITKGVVSRVDYSRYSHSGVDSRLVLQVDAAINHGNSGGPVLFKGRVIGVAFQGLLSAQNIGYCIPMPVIRHFLDDVSDGHYHGYPELGIAYLDTRNTAMRASLSLPGNDSGVVVYYVDPFGSAKGYLQPRDVLLSIDGHPIASDGSILLDGTPVEFVELLERKQWGQDVVFGVWRDGAQRTITAPLRNPADPFIFRQSYDERPEYLIVGGLVFSPLSRDYLQTLGPRLGDRSNHPLLYDSQYAKIDQLYADRDQFIVLIRRLPHPINSYYEDFVQDVVTEANGVRIQNMAGLKAALAKPVNGFHIFHFEGQHDFLVLDAQSAQKADAEILERYGVPAAEFLEPKP